MTIDLTKSTFTAEEAAELERMGYETVGVATSDKPAYWLILKSDRRSVFVETFRELDGNKENKEPSW